MKYYIIAGEASGDLHAANLVKEIKNEDSEAQIRAWGGELLKKQGAEIAKNYNETAFMGFVEVIKNIGAIKKLFDYCKQDILNFKPDIVILVDYPGFNLRIAEFTKSKKILSYYYISPKIWAWKQKRAYKIKAYVDKMFVIFPFEIDFYKKFNYSVEYIGNPLLDEIERQKPNLQSLKEFKTKNKLSEKPIIALLAGSRKQEIARMLPKMIETSKNFPDYQFIIAGAPGIEPSYYNNIAKNIDIIYNQTYDLLKNCKASIVTSGTATLETALFNVPQIVVYAVNPITYLLAKLLVKIEFMSLVNIILDKAAVPELLQNDFNVQKVSSLLQKLLMDSPEKQKMLDYYKKLHIILGEKGASAKAAKIIFHDLNQVKETKD